MEFEKVYSSILKEYPDVMNPEEVANALGISTKTIYQLLRCNKINHIKLHTAVSSGSWCGGQRQQCGDSGSGLR